jgi:hypothetical protein
MPFSPKPMMVALICIMALLCAGPALADDPTATPPEPTLSTTPIVLTIEGTVASGTSGINITPGLPLSLHIARIPAPGGFPAEVLKRDGSLSPDNTFRFEGVGALPGDIAFITAQFEGATQGSQLIRLTNGQSSLNIPVTLYGATNDPGAVSAIRVQHILDSRPGNVLQILATYDYKNTGDRLFVSSTKTGSGQPVSVSVPLPIGARAIAFNTQPASRFAVGGNLNAPVVQDTKPVLPGQVHEIVFSYQLPYTSGAAIDQDYPYNTTSLEILIPDDINVQIGGDQFVKSANTTVNPDRVYTQYVLKVPLRAGDRLIYTLDGVAKVAPTPQPGSGSRGLFSSPVTIIAAIALLSTLVGLFMIRRTMRKRLYVPRNRRR